MKDNRTNYKIGDNELNIEDETVGIYGRNVENSILKKGELVILDVDYIYTEQEYSEKIKDKKSLHYRFSQRYEKEIEDYLEK